jgi:Leucine-rich repeat (LRR) protein
MIASKNAIRTLGDFGQPRLRKLELNDNKIENISDFKGVSSQLKFLSLANNRIRDLTAFANMQHLEELYVSGNKLTSFSELENMPSLKVLHIRGNRIKEIEDIFSAPCLEYVNLRDNAKMEKTAGLERLAGFEVLKKVNF